jgi:putative glycosyltransferase (TIGR04372 family)
MKWRALGSTIARRLFVESRLARVIELSHKGRITQYIGQIEPHLRTKRICWKFAPPLIVCVNPVRTPNSAVRELLVRQAFIIGEESPAWLRHLLAKVAWPAGKWSREMIRRDADSWSRVWERPSSASREIEWTAETRSLLTEMGCDPAAPLVLLAVRDSHYYQRLRESDGPERPGREVEVDTQVRNPDIATYWQACRYLRELGCSVVRMGVDQTPLSQEWDGVAVDYATHHRSERGDLLLARHASFLLNGASGVWSLTSLFNRAEIATNIYSPFIGSGRCNRDIFSPQLRQLADSRLQTFREMAETAREYSYESNLRRDGVTLIKNSSEEILELVQEMLARLDGTFKETKEDTRRRARFDKIRVLSTGIWERGNIGTAFLRRYEHLLD